MKIAVFTGNSRRHHGLVHNLAKNFDEITVISEVPNIPKELIKRDSLIDEYFQSVTNFENEIFPLDSIGESNVSRFEVPYGFLNHYESEILSRIEDADVVVVYGSSYIKNRLCLELISKGAINIHLGISPYFRGSACNYWAIKFGRLDLIGATIHKLGYGLDSGDIFFHVLPKIQRCDPLKLGMLAVKGAHDALILKLKESNSNEWLWIKQDKSLEINCSKIIDFNVEEVKWYFENFPTQNDVLNSLKNRDDSLFFNPIVK